MLPSNVDPRRADRIVRQKPTMNANGQGEDLTPDYMNILGQRATTANATADTASSDRHMVDGNIGSSGIGGQSANESNNLNQTYNSVGEDIDSTTNVIPTSPQYGVAIIPNQAPIITSVPTTTATVSDITTETVTLSTDTITDTQVKQVTEDGKDIHSTPSRNDRFKVVKIASLEPFKRGRWKCMDYVDEAPPPAALQQQQQQPSQQQQQQQQQQNKVTQSSGNIPVASGGIYLQTQSLPQQQIQQMLLQSGYTNGTQFYQNVPTQMMPQTQYFYPAGTNLQTPQTLPQQLINTTGVPTSSIPTQFINTNQPYFTNVPPNSVGYPIPTNYQNLQYVPANMMQPNQNSAFVPTSQTNVQLPTNFQQNQTYAGQPNVNQQPMVNGHAYPTEQQQQQPPSQQPQQQQNTTSLPAQTAKNIILNSIQQPVVNQPPISQPNIQTNPIPVVQTSAQPQTVPVIQPQQQSQNQLFQQQQQQQPPPPQQQQTNFQQVPQQQQQQQVISATSQSVATPQTYEQQTQSSNVYTNPQFDMSVNSLTILENSETSVETVNSNNTNNNNNNNTNETNTVDAVENTDDPSKTNPVVNAIDNKIEQAMDLVKSHLMYTVREEVEVLKEKIAELMERIQQLETENNFLRSQIPKSQTIPPSISSGNGGSGGGGGAIQQTTPTTVNQPAPPPQTQQQPPSSSSTSSAPTNLPTETNPPQQ